MLLLTATCCGHVEMGIRKNITGLSSESRVRPGLMKTELISYYEEMFRTPRTYNPLNKQVQFIRIARPTKSTSWKPYVYIAEDQAAIEETEAIQQSR